MLQSQAMGKYGRMLTGAGAVVVAAVLAGQTAPAPPATGPATAAAAVLVDNPVYAAWKDLKPGTSLVTRCSSDRNGTPVPLGEDAEIVISLHEVKANGVVLELKYGGGTMLHREIPAKIARERIGRSLFGSEGPSTITFNEQKERVEKIDVGGKMRDATVYESIGVDHREDGTPMAAIVLTFVVVPSLPGGIYRAEISSTPYGNGQAYANREITTAWNDAEGKPIVPATSQPATRP
jgi:hypothetical protein